MISEIKAAELIISAEPDLALSNYSNANIFKLAYRFAYLVRDEIVTGEFNRLQQDFETVAVLLKEGNGMVRMAMSNIFIYSIVNTLSARLPYSMKAFQMMPVCLKREYYRQINSSSL